MGLLFTDGCDAFTATDGSDLVSKWAATTGDMSYLPSGGRYGGGGIEFGVFPGAGTLAINFTPTGDTAITDEFFGSFSIIMTDFRDVTPLMELSSNDGLWQLRFYITNSGFIKVYRYSTGTELLIATTIIPLSVDQWYRFEFRVVLDATSGVVEIRVNEVEHLLLTGVRTSASGTASNENVGQANFGYWGGDAILDDVIIHTSAGDDPSDFLGDIRIETIRPNGVGSSSQWTSSSGDGYTNVDESGINDGDSSYVEADDLTFKDLYEFGDLATTPTTIPAISVTVMARATGTTPRNFDIIALEDAVESATNVDIVASADFQSKQAFFPETPSSLPWTKTKVNAMEVGVKLTA